MRFGVSRSGLLRLYRRNRWLKAALQPAPVLCAFMVVVLWIVVTVVLVGERRTAVDAAVQQGNNLVRLFQQNTAAMLKSVDRTLLELRQNYEDDPTHFDFKALLRQVVTADNLTTQFAFADRDGNATALMPKGDAVAQVSLADRKYFTQQRDANEDALLVSGPVLGKFSGRESLILSRRLRHADGSFAGVVGAALDPTFLANFYRSIDIGARGNVVLRDRDDVILASAGTVVPATGRQVLPPTLSEALERAPSGYLWGYGAVDGVERMVFYRRSAELPVIMTVGLATKDVLASYWRTWRIAVWGAAFLTLLLVLGAASSFRHQLRLDEGLKARLAIERDLEHARTFLNTVVEQLPLPIVVKDAKTLKLELVNRAFEAFVGFPREQLVGRSVLDYYPPDTAANILRSDQEARAAQGRSVRLEFDMPTRTSGPRTVTCTKLGVRGEDGQISHLLGIYEDVTDQREFDSRILYMAHHDALTGLANRAAVAQHIEEAAARQRRFGHTFTVLLLDLDRFKYINDTLGHSAGDALLREAAGRLKTVLRETDILARLGGDEFVVIQDNEPNQREAAMALADRILEVIAEPFCI